MRLTLVFACVVTLVSALHYGCGSGVVRCPRGVIIQDISSSTKRVLRTLNYYDDSQVTVKATGCRVKQWRRNSQGLYEEVFFREVKGSCTAYCRVGTVRVPGRRLSEVADVRDSPFGKNGYAARRPDSFYGSACYQQSYTGLAGITSRWSGYSVNCPKGAILQDISTGDGTVIKTHNYYSWVNIRVTRTSSSSTRCTVRNAYTTIRTIKGSCTAYCRRGHGGSGGRVSGRALAVASTSFNKYLGQYGVGLYKYEYDP